MAAPDSAGLARRMPACLSLLLCRRLPLSLTAHCCRLLVPVAVARSCGKPLGTAFTGKP